MSNINLELEDDNYYDKFLEESSPRTNYGDGYSEEYKFKKMKYEYIIINKTILEERVKELEKEIYEYRDEQDYLDGLMQEYNTIKGILRQSKSIPLLPEIEKAFDAGRMLSNKSQLYTPDFYWTKEEYIKTYVENLNL